MDTAEALTTTEQGDFTKLKEEFQKIQKETTRGIMILMEIRDRRLWRVDYESFESFCQLECGITRRHANRLIQGATAVAEVIGDFDAAAALEEPGHNVSQEPPDDKSTLGKWIREQEEKRSAPPVPKGVRQAEALAKSPEGDRAATMKEVADTATKDSAGQPKVTAAHIEKVVAKRKKREESPGDEAESAAPPLDGLGHPIADAIIVSVFVDDAPTLRSLDKRFLSLKREFEDFCKRPGGAWAQRQNQEFKAAVGNFHRILRFSLPYAICPYCGGQRCDACKQTGWMPQEVYNAVPSEMKGAAAE